MELHQIFYSIVKSIHDKKYEDLGNVTFIENNDMSHLKIKVKPHEGFHKDEEYIVELVFNEINNWPNLYVNSPIFDKIKTNQYLANKGKNGYHKGICIKNLSYGYSFSSNFKLYCNNDWSNYLYYIIITFNNMQDFERGNGFKSDYKDILLL